MNKPKPKAMNQNQSWKMRRAAMLLLLCGCCIGTNALFAQSQSPQPQEKVQSQYVTVTGTVYGTDGEPLIGASVIDKATKIGASTDVDGKFSLNVPKGATLTVSYVGMDSQEVKATSTPLEITLKDNAELLNEVVVVGFGTQKKVNLTGSVGLANAKDLESRPVTSATMALQGLIPGLQISTNTGELDKNASIEVRGQGTIGDGSSGSPLILIDGMEGDINNINPQDIETISVLKDAAASSIYGSRAPFGVILVTTKGGSAGKTSVNYNNSFRIASPINMPKQMDSYTFANFFNSAAHNKGDGQVFSDETMQKMLDFQAGKLQHSLDAKPDQDSWEDAWTKGYANTDWWNETYKKNVFSQEHNVSITSGNEKLNFYGSFNYLDQNGTLKIADDGFKRYNVAAKVDVKITDWLKFKYGTRFIRRDGHRPSHYDTWEWWHYFGRQSWPNLPIKDPNGNLMGNLPSTNLAMRGEYKSRGDQNYQQAALVIEPVKNWITNVEFNFKNYTENSTKTDLRYNGYTPSGILIDNKETTSLTQNEKKENFTNLNVYTSYSFSLKNAHNISAMLGFQSEEMKQDQSGVTKYGLMMADMPVFDLTNGLDGNGKMKAPNIWGNHNEWSTAGFFGRINYDYKVQPSAMAY